MKILFRKVGLVACLVLMGCMSLSSCYRLDDDGGATAEEQMLDRRMAQSYILSSYGQWGTSISRSDLEKLARLDSILGEYQWEGKEQSATRLKQYALALVTGNLSYLRSALGYCDAYAGRYEADASKVFRKTQDADHQLKLVFSDSTTFSLVWDVDDGGENEASMQLTLQLNDYFLTGSTTICNDSVNSSYQLAKGMGGEPMMTLQRKMKGNDFLEVFRADSAVSVIPSSSDLSLQLKGGLCLRETTGDWNAFLKFLMEYKGMAATNPKLYLQEWAKVRNELGRTVLARPDGVVLCEIIEDGEIVDDNSQLQLMLCWNDGTTQSLTEFASSTSSQDFAKDAALLAKLFERFYYMYAWEEEASE